MKKNRRHNIIVGMPYYLLKFLIDNNTLSKYIDRVVEYHDNITNWNYNYSKNISGYFVWSTNNENEYWRILNEKYEKYINNIFFINN